MVDDPFLFTDHFDFIQIISKLWALWGFLLFLASLIKVLIQDFRVGKDLRDNKGPLLKQCSHRPSNIFFLHSSSDRVPASYRDCFTIILFFLKVYNFNPFVLLMVVCSVSKQSKSVLFARYIFLFFEIFNLLPTPRSSFLAKLEVSAG